MEGVLWRLGTPLGGGGVPESRKRQKLNRGRVRNVKNPQGQIRPIARVQWTRASPRTEHSTWSRARALQKGITKGGCDIRVLDAPRPATWTQKTKTGSKGEVGGSSPSTIILVAEGFCVGAGMFAVHIEQCIHPRACNKRRGSEDRVRAPYNE